MCQVWASEAHGLSCPIGGGPPLPSPDADNVPTDTLLWGFGESSEFTTIRLQGPSRDVELEERRLEVAGLYEFPVLRPVEELAPDTRYTFVSTREMSTGEDFRVERHFTTGGGPTRGAPEPPALRSLHRGAERAWAGGVGRWIEADFAHDGILVGAIDTSGLPQGDLEAPLSWGDPNPFGAGPRGAVELGLAPLMIPNDDASPSPALVPSLDWLSTDSRIRTGAADCTYWPGYPEERVEVRFGVFDLAGNFSGWQARTHTFELLSTEEAEALVPSGSAAEAPSAAPLEGDSSLSTKGCSLSSSAPAGETRGSASWVWLVALGGVGARRLRARPARCA